MIIILTKKEYRKCFKGDNPTTVGDLLLEPNPVYMTGEEEQTDLELLVECSVRGIGKIGEFRINPKDGYPKEVNISKEDMIKQIEKIEEKLRSVGIEIFGRGLMKEVTRDERK